MDEIRLVNRVTRVEELMALYDPQTGTAHIQFDYHQHRLRENDTYNIMDALMDILSERGCRVIRIAEANRPGYRTASYEVPFADWYARTPVDYGYGAGLQYPMCSSRVRRDRVA